MNSSEPCSSVPSVVPVSSAPLFKSVFLGGFECASHRLADGRRLDLLASTRHDELAADDYRRLRNVGMTTCRDGVPWPLVERDGKFDFSRFVPMVRAARRHGIDVVWDLLRFGWPDGVDPFDGSFPTRFGRYAAAFARWLSLETDRPAMVTPVNEISYLAWAGGDARGLNPFEAGRGVELKAQLVRAAIEAIEAVRLVLPGARFLQPEPIVHIVPADEHPKTWDRVASENLVQFQAWDMLTGRIWPSLGGHPRYLDIVGVSYYPDSQFMLDGTTIRRGDKRYRPLSNMLLEVGERYGRPMIVAETGSEGDQGAAWLRYVSGQCAAALALGCELHAVTLYPIVEHPEAVDDWRRHAGLWDHADDEGHREADPDLLAELLTSMPILEAARASMLRERAERLSAALQTGARTLDGASRL